MYLQVSLLRWAPLFALVLLLRCTPPPPEHISLSWAEDTSDTWVEADLLPNDQARFTLGSQSRIGRGHGIIQSQRLPNRIFFAIRTHSPAYIQLSYDTIRIVATIEQSEPHSIQERAVLPGDVVSQGRTIDTASPYWMPIRIVTEAGEPRIFPLVYGYVELDVPPDGYASQQHTYTVEWRDNG